MSSPLSSYLTGKNQIKFPITMIKNVLDIHQIKAVYIFLYEPKTKLHISSTTSFLNIFILAIYNIFFFLNYEPKIIQNKGQEQT